MPKFVRIVCKLESGHWNNDPTGKKHYREKQAVTVPEECNWPREMFEAMEVIEISQAKLNTDDAKKQAKEQAERQALMAQLDNLGVEYDKRAGVKKLADILQTELAKIDANATGKG